MLDWLKRNAPTDSANWDMADQLVALEARKANMTVYTEDLLNGALEAYKALWLGQVPPNDPADLVGVLDTGVSRSTCSWAPSTAQLWPKGKPTTEAQHRRPS
jgi:hypothetical protein